MGAVALPADLSRLIRGLASRIAALERRATSLTPGPLHLVGDPGEPALENGWTNFGAGHNDVGFWRDGDVVVLQGFATRATNNQMFTLPDGFRPVERVSFVTISSTGYARLDVLVDGRVTLATHPGASYASGVWVSLDGLSFRAA